MLELVLPCIKTNLAEKKIASLVLEMASRPKEISIEQMTIPERGTYCSMMGRENRPMFAADFEKNSKLLIEKLYGDVRMMCRSNPIIAKILLSRRPRLWIRRRLQNVVLSCVAILVLWPLVLFRAICIVIDSLVAGSFLAQGSVGKLLCKKVLMNCLN